MRPHIRQPLLDDPPRPWVRIGFLCAGGLLLLSGAGENPLPGADPAARNHPTIHEIEVTARVRLALVSDPELKDLNLFIRVQAGLATLCGPVPSAELARRAETIVRGVRGVYEVMNLLKVVAPQERAFEIPLKPEAPVQSESARPVLRPNPAATLAGRAPQEPPVPEGGTEPFPDAEPGKPSGADSRVTLGAPVAGPNLGPTDTVQDWIQRIRREDARYRSIQVEVRDAQTLWVYNDPYRGDIVAALAARLRQVPGVRFVVIKNGPPAR